MAYSSFTFPPPLRNTHIFYCFLIVRATRFQRFPEIIQNAIFPALKRNLFGGKVRGGGNQAPEVLKTIKNMCVSRFCDFREFLSEPIVFPKEVLKVLTDFHGNRENAEHT